MASSEVPKKRKQGLLKSHQSLKYPLCFVVRIAWAMQRAHHDDNTHRYWVSVKFPSFPLALNSPEGTQEVLNKQGINELVFVVISPLN